MTFFFGSWMDLARVVVVGFCAYVALILLLRGSRKRTLSKLNAFDFVVTIALGSTLATILLNKEVALAEGVLALGTLIFYQYAITWLSYRSKTVRHLVKAEPRLLLHRGEYLWRAMKHERINEDEILQAMRSDGVNGPSEAEAVVLETDGSLSVLTRSAGEASALANVARD